MNHFFSVLVGATLFLAGRHAYALPSESDVLPQGVTEIDAKQDVVVSGNVKGKDFDTICSRLALALKRSEGAFEKVFCDKDDGNAKWHLRLRITSTSTVAVLSFRPQPGREIPEAWVELPGLKQLKEKLRSNTYTLLIGAELLDQLPIGKLVAWQNTQELTFTTITSLLDPAVSLPKKVQVYRLSYDARLELWVPEILGEASLQANEVTDDKRIFTWKVTSDKDVNPNATYWAQSSLGRGGHTNSLRDHRNGRIYSLQKILNDSVAKGYAGIRLGVPFTHGDPLLTKARFVGVLAEVRGGPLEGLRWYWDFAPKATETVQGEKTDYTWSRASLGWSFSLPRFTDFISNIDIVPKIGLTDFDKTILLTNGFDTTKVVPVNFRLKNVVNLGIEAGIEKQTRWALGRVWAAADLSGLAGTGTVSSQRVGIDTYWRAGETKGLRISLLMFAFAEKLSLEAEDAFSHPLSATSVKGYSYNLGVFGSGITLVW